MPSGATAEESFPSATERSTARTVWGADNERRRKRREEPLPVLGLNDLRHAGVTLAIEAGGHPKRLEAMKGHASITETFDTYGQLWPDGEDDLLAHGRVTRGPSAPHWPWWARCVGARAVQMAADVCGYVQVETVSVCTQVYVPVVAEEIDDR